MSLSIEQEYAFELYKKGKNLFITGPAGTGKTKLIRHFLEYSKMRGDTIQVCALTGCAALLLNCNAKTIHSWSGIKIARGDKESIISKVLRNRNVIRMWKKVKILILDEVSMLSQKIFEILNEIGQRSRNRYDQSFGGIQVIFTGDFYQLPPVGNIEEEESSAFCFESPEWFSVFPLENHIELKKVFRQKDLVYVNILSQIRKGELSKENEEILKKYVKRTDKKIDGETDICIPTKLFPLRSKTEYINNEMFSKINESIYEFHYDVITNNTIQQETNKPISPEVIKQCSRYSKEECEKMAEIYMTNLPCQKILSLKKGAIVMCLINLEMEMGISNGSQGIIIDFIENEENTIPIVKFYNGYTRPIPYYYWQMEDTPTISIGQIPLTLSWAMTIHKMQGATISKAEIDIGNTIFEYGQIYVALSRVETLDGLYILNFNPYKIKANPKVIEFYKKFANNEYNIIFTKEEEEVSKTPTTTSSSSTTDVLLQEKKTKNIQSIYSYMKVIKKSPVSYPSGSSSSGEEEKSFDKYAYVETK